MPIADVNGCEIYYEANGIGPDVVFIHGEDHGIEMFERQVADLCGNYRCVAYYRRGHGKSELVPYGYSLRNQMIDLAGLLDHLEVRQAVIVAVAMATTIAASYALEYPARVRGLVLASWCELDGYPLMERRR
jgi:pimeloyl-ACP methyl ester carboxylesterase